MPLLPALKSETLKRSCDPFGVSEQVDQFLGPQMYTWAELMSTLEILFSGEERAMIRRVAVAVWECEHPPEENVLAVDVKFPNQDPQWNNNTPGHRENMRDLRDLMTRGIWESVPSSQNLSKAFNVQQGKDEGLTKFMSRLKDQMRKYAGLDLEDPLGQGMLKFHFVTISWPNIARKLQKLENWKNRSIEELLGEAERYM
jgi:hypothetical protein